MEKSQKKTNDIFSIQKVKCSKTKNWNDEPQFRKNKFE